jgi:hypothetical protein
MTIAKSKSSRLSYSEVVSLPLKSILSKISRHKNLDMMQICQNLWCPLFRVHRNISSGHNCENSDCWSIYLNVWLKDTASFLLLSCNSFWTNSASYENKNKSANKGAQLSTGMPTDCWNTWSPKTTLDIVYQNVNHTLNVCFRVLVWAIIMVSHKICILFSNY